MRLDELDKVIQSTGPEDWSPVSMPLFMHGFQVQGIEDTGRITAVAEHDNMAVLRADVDVRVAWGFDPNFADRDLSFFPAHIFSDGFLHLGDVFFRGALVDRYELVSVDGGQAVLPRPKTRSHGEPSTTPSGERARYASRREVNFARLVDRLKGNCEFDDYLSASELVVRPD